ncbi:MAG: hypothetical protein LC754_01215 [Acidobacteria bacterium]|nr:hypothetical protein [Acidobacteriota bacterium]
MTDRSVNQYDKQSAAASESAPAGRTRLRDVLPAVVIIVGLALVFFLGRWTEARQPPVNIAQEDEELYVSPEAARRMSFGFNGLVADWYWLSSLQYVGRKITAHQGTVQIDDLKSLDVKQLASLLDHATTLDPQFMAAYEYGAVVLPAIDVEAALRLTRKGIQANPRDWHLYQHLGYIYWQQDRFGEASDAYRTGASQPGAPAWMNTMAAQMQVKGGSRETARDIYWRMYKEGDDEQIKLLAFKRLLQVDSLDQRDAIRRVLVEYQSRSGRCPSAWREVAVALRAAGLKLNARDEPLDPTDVPYALDSGACDAKLAARSEIPQR